MRYALIAVAIGASLLLVWLSWILLPHVLNAPPSDDIRLLALFVSAAAVMALAAAGLMARRAWGAYLLSFGAFVCSLPVAFVALLTLVTPMPGGLFWLGALGLVLGVGVVALRVGKSMGRGSSSEA